MKLITHNMLTSNILKGVNNGFPLKINAVKVENISVDYNRDFIVRILPRIEYDALRAAITDVSDANVNHAHVHLSCSSIVLFVAWLEGIPAGDDV